MFYVICAARMITMMRYSDIFGLLPSNIGKEQHEKYLQSISAITKILMRHLQNACPIPQRVKGNILITAILNSLQHLLVEF